MGSTVLQTLEKEAALELLLPLLLCFALSPDAFSVFPPFFTFSMGYGLVTAFFYTPSGSGGSQVHRYCNQWDFLVLDCWARNGNWGFFVYGSMNGIWDFFTVFSYGFTM